MTGCRLRVYHGPEDSTVSSLADGSRENTVTVPLRDVLLALADAVHSRRRWLEDFADDEMTVSTDLFEVLLAYQHYCRPSA